MSEGSVTCVSSGIMFNRAESVAIRVHMMMMMMMVVLILYIPVADACCCGETQCVLEE